MNRSPICAIFIFIFLLQGCGNSQPSQTTNDSNQPQPVQQTTEAPSQPAAVSLTPISAADTTLSLDILGDGAVVRFATQTNDFGDKADVSVLIDNQYEYGARSKELQFGSHSITVTMPASVTANLPGEFPVSLKVTGNRGLVWQKQSITTEGSDITPNDLGSGSGNASGEVSPTAASNEKDQVPAGYARFVHAIASGSKREFSELIGQCKGSRIADAMRCYLEAESGNASAETDYEAATRQGADLGSSLESLFFKTAHAAIRASKGDLDGADSEFWDASSSRNESKEGAGFPPIAYALFLIKSRNQKGQALTLCKSALKSLTGSADVAALNKVIATIESSSPQ